MFPNRISLLIFNVTRKICIGTGILACYIPSFPLKGATLASEAYCFLENNALLHRVSIKSHQGTPDIHPFLEQENNSSRDPNTPIGKIKPSQSAQQRPTVQNRNLPPPRPRAPRPPRRS